MSIRVTDFKWEKGKNDVKYIELLEKTLKNEQTITAKAVAKIRELSKEKKEIRAKTIDEFVTTIKEALNQEFPRNYESTKPYFTLENARVMVDEIAEQMKGE